MNIYWKMALAVIAAGLLLAGYEHWAGVQQQIGYDRAVTAVNADKVKKIDAAQAETAAALKKYKEAQDENAAKQAEINRLAAANAGVVAGVGKLRVELDNLRAGRMSAITAETCPVTAATLSQLFGSCTERIEILADRYGRLAEVADRHAADVKALISAP